MNAIHGIKPDGITCPCGASGDDVRIISAFNGKLQLRCRRCNCRGTVHIAEHEPDLGNTRPFTKITADLQELFGLKETQDRHNRAYAEAPVNMGDTLQPYHRACANLYAHLQYAAKRRRNHDE
jgi:hypothetical protein